MLPTGWIDLVLRATLLLCTVTLTACSSTDRVAPPPLPVGAASAATPEIETRYSAILSRLRAGDPAATTELERFSAEYPGFAGPLLNLGLIRSRAGDEAGARALIEQASLVCTRCGSVWNELGVLHARHGRFAEAEAAYQKSIEAEPGFAAAYYNLAIVYELYIPRPDLALQNYEQYLQLAGDSDDAQDVGKWVADLRRRAGATATAARAEVAP